MEEKLILLIEDDEDIRNAVRMALEFGGYRVAIAENGKHALGILELLNPLPHLILLDLMMPVMDGWDFAKEISAHEQWGKIPLIVVSAMHDKVGPIHAKEIVKKPIELNALFSAVERSLAP